MRAWSGKIAYGVRDPAAFQILLEGDGASGYNARAASNPRHLMEDTMKKFAFVLFAAMAVTACEDKAGDTGDTGTAGDGGSGGDGGSAGETYVACEWTSSEFILDISGNTDPAGYELGFAETGGSPSWTGEDCGFVGYKASDGTLYEYCHDMGPNGGTLTIVSTFEDINPGSTTILNGATMDIAYYLSSVTDGTCWTWGSDPTYFTGCIDASSAIACAGD